jgi:hypothetical protein
MNPVDGPTRRSYIPDVVLLSKLVGIHAILFAILSALTYLMELQREPSPQTIVAMILLFMALVLVTLVLSLRPAIRMTGMALVSALVVIYALLFAVRNVVAYLGGLQGELSLWWIVGLVALALLTLVLSLGLVVRKPRTWPKHTAGWIRCIMLRFLAAVGIVAFLALPFTRFGWPPYKTSTRAFRRYVLANVDLNAMRAWLNTLDGKYTPNYAYELAYGATIESRWPEATPWAKAITPLRPDHVRLAPDDSDHPTIRIAGLRGHSLVVGSENMQTAPAAFLKLDDYRLSLGPGAYVGHKR